jgi:hypothetical protein
MWTAIWTVVVFVLLLFHGDSILALPPTNSEPAVPTSSTFNARRPGRR